MNTVTLTLIDDRETLECSCGARAHDTSKERGRFLRRHPHLCNQRKNFAQQLAQNTRSVEPTTWEEHWEEHREAVQNADV